MQRLILSAGARVISGSDPGKITDPLFWELLVAVSNEDGTPVVSPLQHGVLEFTVFALIAGVGSNDESLVVVPTGGDYSGPSGANGFYHLLFSQKDFEAVKRIPKVFGVQASIVPTSIKPPHPLPVAFAQGRTVCGVTGEPGYYGVDVVPPPNAQFFFGS
jgi:hypothetical protein